MPCRTRRRWVRAYRMNRRWQAALGTVAGCLVWALPGVAATSTWVGAGPDNKWSTGTNWLGGVAPAPGDDVVISAMRHYFLSLDTSPSVNSLTFDGQYHELDTTAAATLTIGAGGLTMTGDTLAFNSALTISLGAPQTWSIASTGT